MKKYLLIAIVVGGMIVCTNQSQATVLYTIADAPLIPAIRIKIRQLLQSFAPARVKAYSTSANWTEKGITWHNQAALGKFASMTIVGSEAGWYSRNVTSLARLSAGGDLSIALVSNGPGHVYYASETSTGLESYLEVVVP